MTVEQKSSIPVLKLIVAYSRNRTIGKGNALPWHLSADLKHFRKTTTGYPVIMGRKTWESIGRPLPGRLNIVVSKTLTSLDGAIVVNSIAKALEAAAGHDMAFIIGGANLYEQALGYVDEIVATEIAADFEGDAHFPELDIKEWAEVERQPQQPENGLEFAFVIYRRKPLH